MDKRGREWEGEGGKVMWIRCTLILYRTLTIINLTN